MTDILLSCILVAQYIIIHKINVLGNCWLELKKIEARKEFDDVLRMVMEANKK